MSLTIGLFTQVSGSGPLGPLVFIAGRPKAALLVWFFGDFRCARCYLWLFTLYINIKIGKNSC